MRARIRESQKARCARDGNAQIKEAAKLGCKAGNLASQSEAAKAKARATREETRRLKAAGLIPKGRSSTARRAGNFLANCAQAEDRSWMLPSDDECE